MREEQNFHSDISRPARYDERVAFIARDLTAQLKSRGITLESPKAIYFDALDFREAEESYYGLVFNLNEKTELGNNLIDAPELTKDFSFGKINERGIPIENERGDRYLLTHKESLSRFCFKNANIHSNGSDFSYSYSGGRIVAVSR